MPEWDRVRQQKKRRFSLKLHIFISATNQRTWSISALEEGDRKKGRERKSVSKERREIERK